MTWEQLSDFNLRYDNGYKPKINNGYIYIYYGLFYNQQK